MLRNTSELNVMSNNYLKALGNNEDSISILNTMNIKIIIHFHLTFFSLINLELKGSFIFKYTDFVTFCLV